MGTRAGRASLCPDRRVAEEGGIASLYSPSLSSTFSARPHENRVEHLRVLGVQARRPFPVSRAGRRGLRSRQGRAGAARGAPLLRLRTEHAQPAARPARPPRAAPPGAASPPPPG